MLICHNLAGLKTPLLTRFKDVIFSRVLKTSFENVTFHAKKVHFSQFQKGPLQFIKKKCTNAGVLGVIKLYCVTVL